VTIIKNVIYVFGNHEYYNEDMNLINKYKKKYERSDCVHILENDNIVVDDFKIYGATLWFGELDKYEMKFKKYLNDFILFLYLQDLLYHQKFSF